MHDQRGLVEVCQSSQCFLPCVQRTSAEFKTVPMGACELRAQERFRGVGQGVIARRRCQSRADVVHRAHAALCIGCAQRGTRFGHIGAFGAGCTACTADQHQCTDVLGVADRVLLGNGATHGMAEDDGGGEGGIDGQLMQQVGDLIKLVAARICWRAGLAMARIVGRQAAILAGRSQGFDLQRPIAKVAGVTVNEQGGRAMVLAGHAMGEFDS